MATPKKVSPKKVSAGSAYRQSLRERTAASNVFARRDVAPEWSNGEGSKRVKGTVKPGTYIDLYDDVSKLYGEIKKYGTAGRGGGDFPMGEAKANTYKGKQFLSPTNGLQVKSGTIAGPRTARNLKDLAIARDKNAVRDRAIKQTRRKGGK